MKKKTKIIHKEITGDLIKLALKGEFDVIAHGCNCFCIQEAGIASQMNKYFKTQDEDKFLLETMNYQGDINKLGQIEYFPILIHSINKMINVINCYTQFLPGKNLDYAALELCFKKINYLFPEQHLGLPQIGCGIAGGDWQIVKKLIENHLYNVNVTIVNYG
jgi:O-acetyl-ADP-ribose deacetylase (regulator of RNase III)